MKKRPEPTVFIVDDDAPIRKALRLLMKSAGLQVETYDSAQAFLDEFDENRPGCLLLDIRMSGMSGIDLQKRLIEMNAIIPIVFITGHGDVPLAVQAMQDGALDFIQKPFNDQKLLDRIQQAIELDTRNRKQLREARALHDRRERLTPREQEVMDRVVDGQPNKVIAHELGISERTVEIHRSRVMSKMQASSLAHLVKMGLRIRT